MPEDTFEDVRQRLFEAAWDAPAYPPAPERTVARARRRAATTIGGASLAVVLAILVAASVLPADPRVQKVGTTTQVDDREFLVDIKTGRTTEITSNPTFERAWWQNVSPDGRRIAFTSDKTGSLRLYVADLDGSNVQELKMGLSVKDVYEPVWSPDGDRIVFGALDLAHGVTRNLYVIDVATGRVRRITNESQDPWSPEWSPDGRSILYSVIIPGTLEVEGVYAVHVDSGQLRVVDVDTRRVQKVFGGPKVLAGDATWTPDGIVFVRGRDLNPQRPNTVDLAVIRRGGGHPEHLANISTSARFAWTPELSPDGATIAYARDSREGPQIYLYDVATGRNRVLRPGNWVTWVDANTLLVQQQPPTN